MKSKPKGQKYRNLYARGGSIYYQRRVGNRRIRFSCKTDDWNEAAAVARLYEEKKGIGTLPFSTVEVPTFAEFAERYLEEDTGHLAATTLVDRIGYLRPEGLLVSHFSAYRLDEIGAPMIRLWWNGLATAPRADGKTTKPRSEKTKRAYLDVVSSVLGYACDLELIERNPVPAFRESLRRRSGTKGARQEAAAGRAVKPIEKPEDIEALVAAAGEEGLTAAALVLLCLDAGLRLGETLGLRWGSIEWRDDQDQTRALRIEEARPRGGEVTAPKSGRSRRVALSRRLRWVLLELYQSHEQHPAAHEFVLAGVDNSNFRKREWRRILRRAKIGHRALKDLRDTFASQLLTAGVQLGYVSSQLGHADVAVTAKHYARWIEAEIYREPMDIEPGEVPADLLARLSDPTGDPSTLSGVGLEADEASQVHAVPQEIMVGRQGLEPWTLGLKARCSAN